MKKPPGRNGILLGGFFITLFAMISPGKELQLSPVKVFKKELFLDLFRHFLTEFFRRYIAAVEKLQ